VEADRQIADGVAAGIPAPDAIRLFRLTLGAVAAQVQHVVKVQSVSVTSANGTVLPRALSLHAIDQLVDAGCGISRPPESAECIDLASWRAWLARKVSSYGSCSWSYPTQS
jgi:hypothetical protein